MWSMVDKLVRPPMDGGPALTARRTVACAVKVSPLPSVCVPPFWRTIVLLVVGYGTVSFANIQARSPDFYIIAGIHKKLFYKSTALIYRSY